MEARGTIGRSQVRHPRLQENTYRYVAGLPSTVRAALAPGPRIQGSA